MVKLKPLALTANAVAFESGSDGRCTVASFEYHRRKERMASVYLPSRPSERATALREIRTSKILLKTTVVGGDHNCVPDLMLDAHAEYENAHSREWESYLSSLGLSDITREQEGLVKGPYTRMPSSGTYTRIDRILARNNDSIQTLFRCRRSIWLLAEPYSPRPQNHLSPPPLPYQGGERQGRDENQYRHA